MNESAFYKVFAVILAVMILVGLIIAASLGSGEIALATLGAGGCVFVILICNALDSTSGSSGSSESIANMARRSWAERHGADRGAYGPDWRIRRRVTLDRDGRQCQLCSSKTELHVHHIRPLSRGGTNRYENLITLCRRCHNAQHGRRFSATDIRTQHRSKGRPKPFDPKRYDPEMAKRVGRNGSYLFD